MRKAPIHAPLRWLSWSTLAKGVPARSASGNRRVPRRFLATAALAAILAAGVAPAAYPPAAVAGPVPQQAAPCSGVWVVVDFGSLGGVTSRCATSFGTGSTALRSAGFSPTISEGFVDRISGKPGKPDRNKAYWSYWHATRKADGSYGGWTYSNLGANGYKPTAGNAEGWRYQSLSDGKVPPGSAPPATTTAPKPAPKPKPSKTSKPSPKPSATKKPAATSKPTAKTSSPSKSSGTTKPSTAAKPSRTASPASTAKPTVASTTSTPPGSTGQPSTPPAIAAESPSVDENSEQPQATAAADASSPGSPAGLITTVGIVLAGAAGLGGWWWKGRKS